MCKRVRPLRSIWAKQVGGCSIIFGQQRESYGNDKTHIYVLESSAMEKKTQTRAIKPHSAPPGAAARATWGTPGHEK